MSNKCNCEEGYICLKCRMNHPYRELLDNLQTVRHLYLLPRRSKKDLLLGEIILHHIAWVIEFDPAISNSKGSMDTHKLLALFKKSRREDNHVLSFNLLYAEVFNILENTNDTFESNSDEDTLEEYHKNKNY